MKKVLLVMGLVLLAILPVTLSWASSVDNAVTYLQNSYQTAPAGTRDWMAMALAANGEKVSVSTSTGDVLDLARNALALSAQQQTNSATVSQIEQRYSNGNFGDPRQVNAIIFGLLAISTSDKEWLASYPEALTSLAATQNPDGSFDFLAGNEGDVDMTAAAIWALSLSPTAFADPINKAFGYLASAQNSDGGLGFTLGQPSSVASTSWALLAYSTAGRTNSRATSYLKDSQQSAGYWLNGGKPDYLNTAYALMALSAKRMPISFVAHQPTPAPNPSSGSAPTANSPSTSPPAGSNPLSSGSAPVPTSSTQPKSSSQSARTVRKPQSRVVVSPSVTCSASASATVNGQESWASASANCW